MLGLSENEIGIKSKRQLSVINFNPSCEEVFFWLLSHEKSVILSFVMWKFTREIKEKFRGFFEILI